MHVHCFVLERVAGLFKTRLAAKFKTGPVPKMNETIQHLNQHNNSKQISNILNYIFLPLDETLTLSSAHDMSVKLMFKNCTQ